MTLSSHGHDVADGLDQTPFEQTVTYRQFRATILEKCEEKWRPKYGESPRSQLELLRKQIEAFRDHVGWHAVEWFETRRYPLQYIYRALRLDASFMVALSPRDRWLRRIMCFLSQDKVMRLAWRWLAQARTYEGRRFIFRLRFSRTRVDRHVQFTRVLDYGLRRWGAFSSTEVMNAFAFIPYDWIRAAERLGLENADAIVAWVPRSNRTSGGALLWALIRLGAVVNVAESEWVKRWYSPPSYLSDGELDEDRLDEVIRILRKYQIAREQIVRALCTLPHHHLDPTGLARNLELLHERGIENIGLLLEKLGTTLANAEAERWVFLLDDLNVTDAETILQFEPLLETSQPISRELAVGLLTHGATLSDLVQSQRLLLAAGRANNGAAPRAALSVLIGAPYRLSLQQVPRAKDYLCRPGDLSGFLAILDQYGFSDAETVLRFQSCYGDVRNDLMSRLVALARPLHRGDSSDEVLAWVTEAGIGGHIDAYEYLARALKIRTVRQLRQVAKLGFLGVGILRYVVEECGLNKKSTLMEWFYHRAFGVKTLGYWGSNLDGVVKLLVQDAFTRQAFNFLKSNYYCIHEAITTRVNARLGPFPFKGSEEEKQRFRLACEKANEEERAALMPLLPRMLHATSGILLGSTVASAWEGPGALEKRIAELAPLLDDLLAGHGPTTSTLTPLEEDAIGLIYRSAPATIRDHWGELMDRQADIADWSVAPSYGMQWRTTARTLRAPLDKDGLAVLNRAATLATAFQKQRHSDMELACAKLQAEVTATSPDLLDATRCLSVLLAIADGDEVIERWRSNVRALAEPSGENGYEQVLQLQTFFNVGLMDALQARQEAFFRAVSPRSAKLLCRTLDEESDRSSSAHTDLRKVLALATSRVRDHFAAWAAREVAKFEADEVTDHCSQLRAVVTKHPSAFFAKEAVKLCTAANVKMWQESRHAHLVVFDCEHRTLQGMALLYREILPAVHATRPVLVIRAINATGDAMSSYDVGSIVDGFFDIAVQIARDAGCAALAFPPNTGMHLLSNLDPIDQYIGKRYLTNKRSLGTTLFLDEREALLQPALEVQAPFDAYERGQQRVSSLFVVWRASAN